MGQAPYLPRGFSLVYKTTNYSTTSVLDLQMGQAPYIQKINHLLRGGLQHEFLRLDKLWDHALSRSALPLSRATPTGLSRRSRSRVDRAHDRAHSLPLRRGRMPEKKKSHQEKATTQKSTNPYSPVTTPGRSGTPLPSPHRLDGWFIRRPLLDVRCRPTYRRTCKQDPITVKQGSKGNSKPEYKEVRCTLESVCARGTSSGSGGLL